MHTTHLRKVGEAELRYGAVMLTASRRRETLIAEMGRVGQPSSSVSGNTFACDPASGGSVRWPSILATLSRGLTRTPLIFSRRMLTSAKRPLTSAKPLRSSALTSAISLRCWASPWKTAPSRRATAAIAADTFPALIHARLLTGLPSRRTIRLTISQPGQMAALKCSSNHRSKAHATASRPSYR